MVQGVSVIRATHLGREKQMIRLTAVSAQRISARAAMFVAAARSTRQLHARSTALMTGAVAPSNQETYPPPKALAQAAHVKSADQYESMYARSLQDNDGFWREMADKHVTWSKPYTAVKIEGEHGTPDTKWFVGGQLNASFNCVDRHLASRGDKVALLWESDDGQSERSITYRALHEEVCRTTTALKAMGLKKGDVVALYMPMVPEAVFAMLACARGGFVHNAVFAGFSADALRERIQSSSAKVVITADGMYRAGKSIPLKNTVDTAVAKCDSIKNVLVLQRTGEKITMHPGRDVWWHDVVPGASKDSAPEAMDSEDPLFILFTSGSTGKPKGLVHTTGGYLTYAATTTHYAFDLKDSDVYCCLADIGWVTGHSYIVYGPLALGATTVLFEGHPTYPHHGRYWEMVQKHAISIFYTSPTAVRSLMSLGEAPLEKWDRSSLRVLGSVGEPIGPEAWRWLHKEVGNSQAPIIDTYWQTETGGIILSPIPGATTLKAGSACHPFFGIEPALYDDSGDEIPFREGEESQGLLGIKRPWPGIARTILGDHARYIDVYFRHFKKHKGLYITGDQAKRDAQGYFWITGRVDDVINVSGHRISSAEVESAMALHPRTAEAATVSMPHKIKGEALCVFVVLKGNGNGDGNGGDNETYLREVKALVAKDIGKLAVPDHILIVQALPKTRSGKIMRRLLRNIVLGKTDAKSIGDTSTLADPSVVDALIQQVQQQLHAPKAKL